LQTGLDRLACRKRSGGPFRKRRSVVYTVAGSLSTKKNKKIAQAEIFKLKGQDVDAKAS
jgi:hypothetical protein